MNKTDGDRRDRLMQASKVAGVVAVVAVAVWLVPLGTDDAPDTPGTAGASGTTAAPTGQAPPTSAAPRRLSPGAIDDVVPLPDGAYASAATWDGALLWVVAADDPQPFGAPVPDEARVFSIDPETATVVTETVVSGGPSHIVADADGVWVVQGSAATITRLDPTDGSAVAEVPLPADAGGVTDIALGPGSVVVGTEGGAVLRIGSLSGEVQEMADVAPEQPGRIVSESGEVWVLSTSGEGPVTVVDPVDGSSAAVPLESLTHPATFGGLADGELFFGGSGDTGSVVTLVDPSTMEPLERYETPGTLAGLGWVSGTFGALDEDGVFLRIRPAASDDERLRTTWDGASELFQVDRESWMLADDGASLSRVLLTGPAN